MARLKKHGFKGKLTECNGWDCSQYIERIAFSEDCTAQTLPPRVMCLIVRRARRQISVGISIGINEEPLDTAEKSIVIAGANGR